MRTVFRLENLRGRDQSEDVGGRWEDNVRMDKVVPVLPVTEHLAMTAYWGVEVQFHPFLDLGTRCPE
jgi:hypothetical protein